MVSAKSDGGPPRSSRLPADVQAAKGRATFQSLFEVFIANSANPHLDSGADGAARMPIAWADKDGWHYSVSRQPLAPLEHTTALERRIAPLAVEEMTSKEIAKSLGLSEGTVKSYLQRLYRNFGVRSRVGLARYAPLFFFQQPPQALRGTARLGLP